LYLYNLASDNLSHFPFTSDFITNREFNQIYIFFEKIYYMNLGRKLEHEDAINIFFSRLDERVIFALDKFDEISDVPEITSDFLLKLKKLKWKDKKTNKFHDKLLLAYWYAERDLVGSNLIFEAIERGFLLTLTGCSVVSEGRDEIIYEDVIRAFKTYFKLLKTDITKFTTKPEVVGDNGYLVCDKCKEYYKLQPGESPDDFTGECECGGNLKFYENIDWLLEGGGDVGADD